MRWNIVIVYKKFFTSCELTFLFFNFKCTSDAHCSGTDANVCVDGTCVCGKSTSSGTGSKCTTASGKPKCTKTDHTTDAESTDADAMCSVSAYFSWIFFWLLILI